MPPKLLLHKEHLLDSKVSIPSKLLAAVKQQDKERFKGDYTEYNFVLNVIRDAILQDLEDLASKEESEELFGKPNWNEHQAYLLGQRKAFKATLKYFNNRGES